ncbi:PspC domain-containing protein [Spirillospora sp. CA-294931]|uniref:PspC domain-containing protein n=1 Tax=Spirillospora sp. CA-294931 TaxID=3240042 RepID=UPI003D9192E9
MAEDHSAISAAPAADDDYPRLAREHEGRVLAGVCTGLGRATGIDPVVFRIGFAVLVLASGQGILLYIAAALLMPSSPANASVAENVVRRWFDAPAVLTILGALLGASVLVSTLGGMTGDTVVALTVFGLALLVAHARGVGLDAIARSVPERLKGHPPGGWVFSPPPAPPQAAETGGGLREGMVDLAAFSSDRAAPAPPAPRPEPAAVAVQGRSALTPITLLAALAVGAAMIPVARAHPAADGSAIVLASALAVVGAGLLAGGWFRARGLATAGTVLTFALLTSSVAGELPRNARYGEVVWRPTDVTRAQQDHKLAVGSGRLDLTALPLAPGQRVSVNAEVMVGGMKITVPPTARVELDARIGLGDMKVDGRTYGGPGAETVEVLEPVNTSVKNPPVIALRVRAKVGEVDVIRG